MLDVAALFQPTPEMINLSYAFLKKSIQVTRFRHGVLGARDCYLNLGSCCALSTYPLNNQSKLRVILVRMIEFRVWWATSIGVFFLKVVKEGLNRWVFIQNAF